MTATIKDISAPAQAVNVRVFVHDFAFYSSDGSDS